MSDHRSSPRHAAPETAHGTNRSQAAEVISKGGKSRVKLGEALIDVRALGALAGIRACYEASKALGGHRLVFGGVAFLGRSPRAGDVQLLPGWGTRRSASGAVATRTLAEAEHIVAGHVMVFGREVRTGADPDWDATLEEESTARWPSRHWWTIDVRSGARSGDVKWTWELGRHRHLVVLARAAVLAPHGSVFLRTLEAQLRSWFVASPPEIGIHWYSNLELALRALRWLEVLGLVGDRLAADVRATMAARLAHTARHLVADLPYTVSTMRNNHLLGDGLGLLVLGAALDRPRPAALGRRCFDSQLARHLEPDGSMIEDSLSYHRFVLEMLIARTLVDDDRATRQTMASSSQFLCRLGALDGAVPQYGDWDEGRVLTATGDASDLAGVARAGLAISGTGAPEEWRAAHDEVAWYAPAGEPVAPEPAERHGGHVGGGIARAVRGPFTAWLKAGGGPSHTHADRCSLSLRAGDHWVLLDPGTGTYNGPIEHRNYFRTSLAHDVLRLAGEDQLSPHRAFRWIHSARGAVGPPLVFGDAVVMWGAHDAYHRLDPPRRVARTALVRPDGVLVADWVEGPPGVSWSLSLPLGATTALHDGEVVLPDGTALNLLLPGRPVAHRGESEPFDGWWSPTYGTAEPSTRLAMEGTVDGPVWWWIGTARAAVTAGGSGLDCDGMELDVSWNPAGATLHIEMAGKDRTAFLRLA